MKLFIELYTSFIKEGGIIIIEDIKDIMWLDILINTVPDNFKKCNKTYDLREIKNRKVCIAEAKNVKSVLTLG